METSGPSSSRSIPASFGSIEISPEEAIAAVSKSSLVMPSGNMWTGKVERIARTNAALGGNLAELLSTPIRPVSGTTVYLRDIGTVENGTDIVTAYAHVDGKRTVYIPVTKRADASTLAVINAVKAAIPAFKKVVPEDVDVSLQFDQSPYVTNSLRGLVIEGLLGAALTGLMVLIFLRDWRSALIVVMNIPFALLSAVILLWVTGQTINIMTLGGLALAVGVLVDEATVEIENIHTQMLPGVSRARAVVEACSRTAIARLLSMFCILAVFVPSFFMIGVSRQLFVPLSLAVGVLDDRFLSAVEQPGPGVLHLADARSASRRGGGGLLRPPAVVLRKLSERVSCGSAGRWRSFIWCRRSDCSTFCCRAWERNSSPMSTPRCCASACAPRPARASRKPSASCCARWTSSSSDGRQGQRRDHQRFRGPDSLQLPGGPDPPVHQRTAGRHHPGRAEAGRPARRRPAGAAARRACETRAAGNARSHSKPATSSPR